MNKKNFWPIAIILLSGLSCTKKNPSPGDNEQGCLIAKVTDIIPKGSSVYSYDAQSRWIKRTSVGYLSNGDSSTYTIDIQYNSDSKITTIEQTVGSGILLTTVYNIKNNLATDAVATTTQPVNGATLTTTTAKIFEHDSNGYITKETDTTSGPGFTGASVCIFTYENGNIKTTDLVSTTNFGGISTDEQINSFTYDKVRPTALKQTASDYNSLISLPSKNYILSQTITAKSNGVIINTDTINSANTYDKSGLLVKTVQTSSGYLHANNSSTYSYSCGH